MFPKKLQAKIQKRRDENSFRKLGTPSDLIDFSSNDYLGFSKSETLYNEASEIMKSNIGAINGSSGSRLLTGNHALYPIVEHQLAKFHKSEEALIFNSGYDANVGFFSCIPQRGDVIFYDEYIHASIRDGITISNADTYKFKHNDLEDLHNKLDKIETSGETYIVTESVFSMDGDTPDLLSLIKLTERHNSLLIVDEAHAVGVFGEKGTGIVQDLNIQNKIFARLVTFGKAMGCHGAAILCNKDLKDYLVNYARSIIYTTALPPHSLATISAAYHELSATQNLELLHTNIQIFKSEIEANRLKSKFIPSNSAIQSCVIRGNDKVKDVATAIKVSGFNVKPILYPSVAKGQERLRFCIHSYNKQEEITEVLTILSNFVGQKMSTVDE